MVNNLCGQSESALPADRNTLMKRNGFSLIELLIVIAIISILLSIATLQFNEYTRKANIEAQTKIMYADLMNVRSEALFQKKTRSVTVSATEFSVYSSATVTGAAPVISKTLSYPVVYSGGSTITFNTQGLLDNVNNKTICVEPYDNHAAYDSLVLFTTRIELGKRDPGYMGCDHDYIKTK